MSQATFNLRSQKNCLRKITTQNLTHRSTRSQTLLKLLIPKTVRIWSRNLFRFLRDFKMTFWTLNLLRMKKRANNLKTKQIGTWSTTPQSHLLRIKLLTSAKRIKIKKTATFTSCNSSLTRASHNWLKLWSWSKTCMLWRMLIKVWLTGRIKWEIKLWGLSNNTNRTDDQLYYFLN